MNLSDQDGRVLTKGEKRKREILDTAIHQLIEYGYVGFSMRNIAKELGISLGNLQYHYPDKKKLISDLLQRILNESLHRINQSFSNLPSSTTEIEKAIEIVLDGQTKESCQVIYEIWAMATRDKDVSEELKGFYDQYCKLVTGIIEYNNPSLKKKSARMRSIIIVSLLEGFSIFRIWDDGKFGIDPTIEKEIKSTIVNYMIQS